MSGVRYQVSLILGYQATGENISIQDHQQSSITELKAVAHCDAAAHLLSTTQCGAIKSLQVSVGEAYVLALAHALLAHT